MNRPLEVLIVDDAVVVRRMVSEVLAEDPDIHVAGCAANGRIALQKLAHLAPDAVTLDIDMPEMNGLDTLREIRRAHPSLPVIMLSSLVTPDAGATLDALALGASDCVMKPSHAGSVSAAKQHIREELIPKLKAACRLNRFPAEPLGAGLVAVHSETAPGAPPEAVVIGVSTGGPNALAALLPALPDTFPVPILIVQHMPPEFTGLLADRLNAQSRVKVIEAQGNEVLQPGVAYIAPGGRHLTVHRQGNHMVTALNEDLPENSCRPAVDVLFRSASQLFGSRVVAVVLTGMGQDGLRGCEAIRRRQGQIVVQDQSTSVVWGMPGFVAQAGLADRVLPLNSIAGEIVRRCGERPPR